jgi:hypothetical protein
VQATDGEYVLAASSTSPVSGNKTEPNQGTETYDFWILKLRPDLLNPRPLLEPGITVTQEGFHLQLSGPTNTYVVDYSTNLQNWFPLQTSVLLSNAVEVVDPGSGSFSRRYYRARINGPDERAVPK